MNQMKRRRAYQYGTLALESRRRGPDVCVYRPFECTSKRKWRRKVIVGTVEREVATPVALHYSLQSASRLDICFSSHQRPTATLAFSTAQDSHQTGSCGGWASEYRLAQSPAHGECLGQGSGPGVGTGEDTSASREHRDDLERVLQTGTRRQATNSASASRIRQTASSGRSLETHLNLATNPARYHSVTLRDPYLTHILFGDLPEVQEKIGSSGRTRICMTT